MNCLVPGCEVEFEDTRSFCDVHLASYLDFLGVSMPDERTARARRIQSERGRAALQLGESGADGTEVHFEGRRCRACGRPAGEREICPACARAADRSTRATAPLRDAADEPDAAANPIGVALLVAFVLLGLVALWCGIERPPARESLETAPAPVVRGAPRPH